MKLNAITNDGAKNLANYYEKSLLDPKSDGTDRYEAFFTLGLLAWRAGDAEKSAALLADASKEAVDVVASSSRDTSDTAEPRTPRRLAIPFLMALQFGDEATRARLAALPRIQWNHPETDEYKPLADLLEVLIGYATKKPLNSETLRSSSRSTSTLGAISILALGSQRSRAASWRSQSAIKHRPVHSCET
jgi:hypothetical protein